MNRKGAKNKKYEIDSADSEVLHMIDDMTIHKRYGSYKMADGSTSSQLEALRLRSDDTYNSKWGDGSILVTAAIW